MKNSTMIYSNNPLALEVASFCYNYLNISGRVIVEAKPLEVDGYCHSNGFIEINENLNKKDFIIAVCHEMVHCLQYKTGKLANEDEAYSRETELYSKFME